MKNNIQKKKQEGFTIIEVLIVLAIAGLIILIVFLAVPALQRNSRNTQRKNDVSAIGGALNEFVNNNGGQLPADNTAFQANVRTNAKTSYYDPGTATAITFNRGAQGTNVSSQPTADTVVVQGWLKCSSATAASTTGATSRSVIALYLVESGTGTTPQCQEL